MSSLRGGGGGGEGRGIGRDFDIFQKIAVKFPSPGQKCEVKYNWNSPTREMICGRGHEQKFKHPYPLDSKIIQMPYPRFKAIDPNPALCPASHTAVKRKNPTPLPVFAASNFVRVWRENLQDFCRKML